MKWLDALRNQWKIDLDSTSDAVVYSVRQQSELEKKRALLNKREAELIKVKSRAIIYRRLMIENETMVNYAMHHSYFIKQKEFFFIEENVEHRQAVFVNNDVVRDRIISLPNVERTHTPLSWEDETSPEEKRAPFIYDRLAAVKYAERWWNSYNPRFKKFEVDCTNFISQCLLAGGAPMTGYPKRNRGWWYQHNNWSYSWAVAHSLRWYLSGAKRGLRAKEVSTPEELQPGDVICYDFQGDGRYDHNTIVVAKDGAGMPLVNAHTNNSRMRYWSYEDSAAYTPNIQYKFFQIVDDR